MPKAWTFTFPKKKQWHMCVCVGRAAVSTGVWHVMMLEWFLEVNCPWNSIVNLCCFNGCIFYSRSVDTGKQIIPTPYIYLAQTRVGLGKKFNPRLIRWDSPRGWAQPWMWYTQREAVKRLTGAAKKKYWFFDGRVVHRWRSPPGFVYTPL